MPRYGAVYQPTMQNVGYHQPRQQPWNDLQQEQINQNPAVYNSWLMNQYQPGSLSDRFTGFYRTWLGDQPSAFAGAQLDNPDLTYQQFIGSRNPWTEYEQMQAPNATRAMRQTFGTRQIRR